MASHLTFNKILSTIYDNKATQDLAQWFSGGDTVPFLSPIGVFRNKWWFLLSFQGWCYWHSVPQGPWYWMETRLHYPVPNDNSALIEKYSFSPHLPFQKYFLPFFCFTYPTLDTQVFLLVLDNALSVLPQGFCTCFPTIFPLFESFIFSLDSGLCSHTTSLITLIEIPLSHCALTYPDLFFFFVLITIWH